MTRDVRQIYVAMIVAVVKRQSALTRANHLSPVEPVLCGTRYVAVGVRTTLAALQVHGLTACQHTRLPGVDSLGCAVVSLYPATELSHL